MKTKNEISEFVTLPVKPLEPFKYRETFVKWVFNTFAASQFVRKILLEENQDFMNSISNGTGKEYLLDLFRNYLPSFFEGIKFLQFNKCQAGSTQFTLSCGLTKINHGRDSLFLLAYYFDSSPNSKKKSVPKVGYVRCVIIYLEEGLPKRIFLNICTSHNQEKLKEIFMDGSLITVATMKEVGHEELITSIRNVVQTGEEIVADQDIKKHNQEIAENIWDFSRNSEAFKATKSNSSSILSLMAEGYFKTVFFSFVKDKLNVELDITDDKCSYKSYSFGLTEEIEESSDKKELFIFLTFDFDKVHENSEGEILGHIKHVILRVEDETISEWYFVEERPFIKKTILYCLFESGKILPCGEIGDTLSTPSNIALVQRIKSLPSLEEFL